MDLREHGVFHPASGCGWKWGVKNRWLKLIAALLLSALVATLLQGRLSGTASRLKEFVTGHERAPAEVQTRAQPAPAPERKRMIKFSQNNVY
jgi:hypothetical protein